LLERIEDESFWLRSAGLADELVWGEALEGLQSLFGNILSCDKAF
jgi:hypothetical protein